MLVAVIFPVTVQFSICKEAQLNGLVPQGKSAPNGIDKLAEDRDAWQKAIKLIFLAKTNSSRWKEYMQS